MVAMAELRNSRLAVRVTVFDGQNAMTAEDRPWRLN